LGLQLGARRDVVEAEGTGCGPMQSNQQQAQNRQCPLSPGAGFCEKFEKADLDLHQPASALLFADQDNTMIDLPRRHLIGSAACADRQILR
jgi:hypothetical protein